MAAVRRVVPLVIFTIFFAMSFTDSAQAMFGVDEIEDSLPGERLEEILEKRHARIYEDNDDSEIMTDLFIPTWEDVVRREFESIIDEMPEREFESIIEEMPERESDIIF